jgi:hypothetical protein
MSETELELLKQLTQGQSEHIRRMKEAKHRVILLEHRGTVEKVLVDGEEIEFDSYDTCYYTGAKLTKKEQNIADKR